MTFCSSEQCPMPTTLASTYAALIASLPDVSSGLASPLGGWLVTVEGEGEPAEAFEAVLGSDGQYLETGPRGNLECLGFGNWQSTGPDTFEVTSQRPHFDDKTCVGWVETKVSGVLGKGASYQGIGQRTTFDLLGQKQSTVTVTVRAKRPNSTFGAVSPA